MLIMLNEAIDDLAIVPCLGGTTLRATLLLLATCVGAMSTEVDTYKHLNMLRIH